MDKKLTADILATCNTIGYSDGNKYFKDPECLASVKDLVLYLRRDDDDHSIRRLLGQSEVVHRDLLPLIKHYYSDLELYDVVLRLLVNLTNPALLVYEEHIPKNKTYRNYYQQITEHLQSYKQAFADELLWKQINERLKKTVAMDWDSRLEGDKLTIERILLLTRNVLQVPADPAEEKRSDDDATVHDQIIHVLHLSGLLETLLKMSSNSDTADDYSLHILEIITLILREHGGEQLARTALEKSNTEKEREEEELAQLMAKENMVKSLAMKKLSSRHSRFGGTFTVRDLKAPSGRNLLCHKPVSSVADLSLDVGKKAKKIARNRLPVNEIDATRRSTLSIRLILQNFCWRFLNTSYNFIMRLVKDRIDRSKTQEHDETYFLWALKFFMEFNRFYTFKVSYVSETMSTGTFHYIQTLLDNYRELMVTDKEKLSLWSKRTHSALRAYQELLNTLFWMDKCETEAEPSHLIKRTVFYLPEYRELCYTLLINFESSKYSKLYFYDLIETNHLFLKMLEEYFASPENRKVVIKVKKKAFRLPKKSKARKSKPIKMDSEELEESWRSISGEVSEAALSSESLDESVNVLPFDAASDLPIDEQKPKALERIAMLLHTKKFLEAATLLRNSKEVWADFLEEVNADGDDDVAALKSIYTLKLNGLILPQERTVEVVDFANFDDEETESGRRGDRESEEDGDEHEISDSGSDGGQDDRFEEREQDFEFKAFLDKYAHSKILSHYGGAFRDWAAIKPLTFQCILKMFHRIAFQLDYPALICQASIFKTFQAILRIPKPMNHLKEAVQFFYHLWPKFVKICEANPKMFLEMLFWKTTRDAIEIQEGYGTYATSKQASKKSRRSSTKFVWTEVEENELDVLAREYVALSVEDRKKCNIVDWINLRFTSGTKVKKTIKAKLKEKGILDQLRATRAQGSRKEGGNRKGRKNKTEKILSKGGHLEGGKSSSIVDSDLSDRMGSDSDDESRIRTGNSKNRRIRSRSRSPVSRSSRSSSRASSSSSDSDSSGSSEIPAVRRRFAELETAGGTVAFNNDKQMDTLGEDGESMEEGGKSSGEDEGKKNKHFMAMKCDGAENNGLQENQFTSHDDVSVESNEKNNGEKQKEETWDIRRFGEGELASNGSENDGKALVNGSEDLSGGSGNNNDEVVEDEISPDQEVVNREVNRGEVTNDSMEM